MRNKHYESIDREAIRMTLSLQIGVCKSFYFDCDMNRFT